MSDTDPRIPPKISDVNKVVPAGPDVGRKQPQKSGDETFHRILTNRIQDSATKSLMNNTEGLPEIEGAYRAARIDLTFDREIFTRKLDSAVQMLETYAAWLADPDKTLKQAGGLLEQVFGQAQSLSDEYGTNLSGDAEAGQILSQLLATVRTEQIKLDRGDYL